MQFLDLSWWQSAIRGLMAMLCQLIYPLISGLYTLFMNVSKVNILSTDNVQPIYQRVTMILTIVMVFYVTFEAVKYVVQPDEITDKEKGAGKLVYKLIMVVILIAFVPTIFEWAFKLQTAIVDKGIIGRVIIGNKETDPSKFGPTFASSVFHMFYHVDKEDIEKTCENIKCGTLVQMNLYTLQNAGELPYLTVGLNASEQKNTGIDGKKAEMPLINFEFHGLLAVIVGGFIVYILALYCIDVGVRWAQMIFLQIVAPIPIIGYLSPKKDGIFQKWCQQCLTTYLDLFIRTAIIYFILLICSVLLDARESGNLFANLTGISGFMEILIYVVLILGVMMFAQKAPKLLEELFPKTGAASGNFGLSGKDRFEPTINAVKGAGKAVGGVWNTGKQAVGAIAGGIGGAIAGGKYRGLSGFFRGAKAGAQRKGGLISNVRKGMGEVRADAEKDKDIAEAGGKPLQSRFFGGHYQTKANAQKRTVDRLDTMSKKKKEVSNAIGDVKFRKQMDSVGAALSSSGNTAAATAWEGTKKQAEKLARQFAVGKIDAATFQAQMDGLVASFNSTHFADTPDPTDPTRTVANPNKIDAALFDLETSETSKWSKVQSTIKDAAATANEIKKETYVDSAGNTHTIGDPKTDYEADLETFADDIGDITDGAEAASTQFQTSDDYKRVQANAQGSKK